MLNSTELGTRYVVNHNKLFIFLYSNRIWKHTSRMSDEINSITSWIFIVCMLSIIHWYWSAKVLFTLIVSSEDIWDIAIYPNEYPKWLCFDVLCCGKLQSDLPLSPRITSLQSYDYHNGIYRNIYIYIDVYMSIYSVNTFHKYFVGGDFLILIVMAPRRKVDEPWSGSFMTQVIDACMCHQGSLLWFTLISAWIINYIQYKKRGEITYQFPNLITAAVEVWEWISYFIPHFTGRVITYPCRD